VEGMVLAELEALETVNGHDPGLAEDIDPGTMEQKAVPAEALELPVDGRR